MAGARLDRNSAFGSFPTLRASAAYVLSGATRVRVSAGSAFTAPSFYENFATGYVTGNPNLQPEHSRSAEVGFDAFLDGGRLTLKTTGFVQRFHDIIDYASVAPFAGAPNYFNVAAANANGVEVEAEYRASGGVTLSAGYTYTDTRATTIGFDSTSGASYVPGQPLIRRPRNSWNVSALQDVRERLATDPRGRVRRRARRSRLHALSRSAGHASRLHESGPFVRAAAAVALLEAASRSRDASTTCSTRTIRRSFAFQLPAVCCSWGFAWGSSRRGTGPG